MTAITACENFAAGRHWIISRAEALARGAHPRAISRRVASGGWRIVYPGVYIVGHAHLNWKSRLVATLVWAGPGAVVSGRSAGALFGFLPLRNAPIEITTRKKKNSRHGIIVHYDPSLPVKPKVFKEDLPITSVPRTLRDLCAALPRERAIEAVRVALKEELTTIDRVARFLVKQGGIGVRGSGQLRWILTKRFAHGVTDSEAEDLFMELAPRYGFQPMHHHIVVIEGREIEFDFFVPPVLDVEVDGSGVHGNPVQYEKDRERDAFLERHGYQILRCTYWQLVNDPAAVFARIRARVRV